MKLCKFIILLFCIPLFNTGSLMAQCGGAAVNHWESCVLENHSWKYVIPAAAIPNWHTPAFNDASWLSGAGGIGYGDGDDATVVANLTRTVYMRRTFNIVDTSLITAAVLCMDYDDGFVAYLNGTEIARVNLGVNPVYNALATASHEAQLFQSLPPDYFIFTNQQIDTLFKNGTNVLAIEVHNNTANSNDLSSRPFLQLGLTTAAINYSPVPVWFVPPTPLYTNLPIIVINTLGGTIVDDPRIICDMGIIDNAPANMNCIYDPWNNYNGKVSIEIRGSSSQSVPKKGYGFSTCDALGVSQNVELLGMPKENDWVLNATYTDKTFLRDVMIYDIARRMGWYTSRVRYVELVINGEYRGIYILQEKVKQDKNRVDVEELTTTMNAGDSLTGGYVYKIDWQTGAAGGAWSSNQGVSLQFHDPSVTILTATQENYLKNYINSFETDLFGAQYTSPVTGYRKKANPYSFADDFILQEFSNNIDAYRASNYLHKDRDSKCGRHTLAPYWDFNFTFGTPDWCFGENTAGWQITGGCGNETNLWIERMITDQWFKNLLNCRWNALRQSYMSNAALFTYMDSIGTYIHAAAVRDSAKWGLEYWPTGWIPVNLARAVDTMKDWMTLRLAWMDANMYPTTIPCGTNANLSVVIDEINFHSDSTTDAGDWLELYNFGATPVDLSSAVILDGDSYEKYCVLPANTTIAAGGRLVVYADSIGFVTQFPSVTNKVGPLCFKLSNSGQKIVIRDKDNKFIYQVNYSDTWQCVTDGNGRTLQLVAPASPPDAASSWYAGCMGGSPGVAYTACTENLIYSEINYASSIAADAGDWIELYNKNTTPFNLNGWSIRDGSSNNVYTFPSGTSIPGTSYLVVYQDAAKFTSRFPLVTNKVGPIGFGFSATGDVARVYDNTGKLRYSVCYGTSAPWPTAANAQGKTMENGQYAGNHNAATTWFAGCPEGSPGSIYNPNCAPNAINEPIEGADYISLYPNPASSTIQLLSSLTFEEIRIFDNTGRMLTQFKGNHPSLDISTLPMGMYQLQCLSKNRTYTVKFVKAQ